MLQMAQLFKNVIPLETLLNMPLRMVHVLREIRIEQLEKDKRDADQQQRAQAAGQQGSNNQFSGNSGLDLAAMEEFIEEHS